MELFLKNQPFPLHSHRLEFICFFLVVFSCVEPHSSVHPSSFLKPTFVVNLWTHRGLRVNPVEALCLCPVRNRSERRGLSVKPAATAVGSLSFTEPRLSCSAHVQGSALSSDPTHRPSSTSSKTGPGTSPASLCRALYLSPSPEELIMAALLFIVSK